MSRFLRSILFALPTMAALVGGAILVGHIRPSRDYFHEIGIDSCGGTLCFLGITPGVTKWDEAIAILDKHGFAPSGLEGQFYTQQLLININFDPKTEIVSNILVGGSYGKPMPLNIGNGLIDFGVPCYVRPSPEAEHMNIYLTYPQLNLTLFSGWQR